MATRKRRPRLLPSWAKTNVAAGFYDEDGYFHPIRASYDYSPKRAGEGRKKGKRNPSRRSVAKTNVAAGFYDEDGYFHPIRASYDYSPSRAGEGRKKGKRNPSKRSVQKRVSKALKKFVRGNPPRVKGRKVKGGRAVTLKNFTGTIVRKSDGRVEILGRGRK